MKETLNWADKLTKWLLIGMFASVVFVGVGSRILADNWTPGGQQTPSAPTAYQGAQSPISTNGTLLIPVFTVAQIALMQPQYSTMSYVELVQCANCANSGTVCESTGTGKGAYGIFLSSPNASGLLTAACK